MRLLIDECIDEPLRYEFPDHDCQTARYAQLAGSKNGNLLLADEAAGFDVITTVDQSIPWQQNLAGRNIAPLILCADQPALGSPTTRASGLGRFGEYFAGTCR